MLELEHDTHQYTREICELKERLASLRFQPAPEVAVMQEICEEIVRKEKKLLHERMQNLVEFEKELKLADIGLSGALSMGSMSRPSSPRGRPVSPRGDQTQKSGFFSDKWHKLVSLLRHSKPKTALDEAFAMYALISLFFSSHCSLS